MRTNVKQKNTNVTHEGAPSPHINHLQQLRRSLLSCMLFENEFYEDGVTIAWRISELASHVATDKLSALAIEARHVHNLRHAPLLILLELIKRGGNGVAQTIASTIGRPDEMAELVSLYWRTGNRKMLPKQMKLGLSMLLNKFSEYALAKNDRPGALTLRDVMFLVRAKPNNEERAELFKRIANKELVTPDTWEVALSGGADKKETFERLIKEGNLGYMALLRNLRNMEKAGVDETLVNDAIIAKQNGAEKLLPFRYVAAARAAPSFEPSLDKALCDTIAKMTPLSGKTAVLVDVSGSMFSNISGKSDMSRADAAATLASVINGNLEVYTFSNNVVQVPARRGMAGVDAVINSQSHGGTELGKAVSEMNKKKLDRLIVITDEQSADRVPAPKAKYAYMINVASNKNGVGYKNTGWTAHIDGFSEAVIRFIYEIEKAD